MSMISVFVSVCSRDRTSMPYNIARVGTILWVLVHHLYHNLLTILHLPPPKPPPALWTAENQLTSVEKAFVKEASAAARKADLRKLMEVEEDTSNPGYMPLSEVDNFLKSDHSTLFFCV